MPIFKKKEPGGFLKKILHFIKWLDWGGKIIKLVITVLRDFPPIPEINETDTDTTKNEPDN
ncbi:hypothetical protein ES705_28076 [subsurface metagenome]